MLVASARRKHHGTPARECECHFGDSHSDHRAAVIMGPARELTASAKASGVAHSCTESHSEVSSCDVVVVESVAPRGGRGDSEEMRPRSSSRSRRRLPRASYPALDDRLGPSLTERPAHDGGRGVRCPFGGDFRLGLVIADSPA
jgi:hypothetical protein